MSGCGQDNRGSVLTESFNAQLNLAPIQAPTVETGSLYPRLKRRDRGNALLISIQYNPCSLHMERCLRAHNCVYLFLTIRLIRDGSCDLSNKSFFLLISVTARPSEFHLGLGSWSMRSGVLVWSH